MLTGKASRALDGRCQGAMMCLRRTSWEDQNTPAPAAGVSLSRGAFRFTPGAWHQIGVTVRMNDVGKANGVVEITLNGKRKIYYDKIRYRTRPGRWPGCSHAACAYVVRTLARVCGLPIKGV